MTQPTPPPAAPATADAPTVNPSAVAAPPNYYQGPNWHGAWASVTNGTYGGPNQIVPRKNHPYWE